MVKSLFKIKYLFVVLMLLCIVPMVCACDSDSDKDNDKKDSSYTITYELDGGTNALTNPSSYTKDSQTIILSNPTKEGYTFVGWYSESSFDNQVTKIYSNWERNVELYAKFQSNPGLFKNNTCVKTWESLVSYGDIVYNRDTFTIISCNTSLDGELKLPNFVQHINGHAFNGCSKLLTISFEENSQLTTIGDFAFFESGLVSITIPSSVTSIDGSSSFTYCYALAEIYNLSNLNIMLGSTTNGNIGEYAKVIHTNANDTSNIVKQDNIAYYVNGSEIIALRTIDKTLTTYTVRSDCTKFAKYAFSGCEHLTTITIPSAITCIEEGMFFGCDSLTNIIIPSNVTIIDNEAFGQCTSLTSITIPSNVTSIGRDAYAHCTSLTNVTIQGTGSIEIGLDAFGYYDNVNPGQLKLNGTGATLQSLNNGTRTGINGTYFLNNEE